MRHVLFIGVLLALMACEAPEAGAQGGAVETQSAYMERCRRETIARYPNARAQADGICQSQWEQVVVAGPIADALLAVAPAPGATFDPTSARTRLNALRGFDVATARAPAPTATISWFRDGEPIPFNLEDALRGRGATLSMIACLSFGSSEGTRVYRIEAPGKAPFALTVAFRNAAVASQSSNYSATADFSARLPTLAALARDGSGWTATCPE